MVLCPSPSFLKRKMQIKEHNLAKRKFCNINLDCDLIKQIEIMATHLDKRQNELIEEAIQDLLKKYKDLDRPAEPSSTELFLIKTLTKNT
jgi:metal-responsive CopG/Arc/MetJ family transcriptional regulator